jgi:hypothetical protein
MWGPSYFRVCTFQMRFYYALLLKVVKLCSVYSLTIYKYKQEGNDIQADLKIF